MGACLSDEQDSALARDIFPSFIQKPTLTIQVVDCLANRDARSLRYIVEKLSSLIVFEAQLFLSLCVCVCVCVMFS